MNVADLAEALRNARDVSYNGCAATALLIGFDGSAELLGHKNAGSLEGQIMSPQLMLNRNQVKIQTKWANLSDERRAQLYDQYTSPGTCNSQALEAAACLLRDGYINVIIAADSQEVMRDFFRTELQGVRGFYDFRCYDSIPDRLARLTTSAKWPIFIDGREMLLELRPYTEAKIADSEGIFREIRQCLNKMSRVLCWGLTHLNINLSKILPDEQKALLLLGLSSGMASAPYSWNTQVVESPKDNELAPVPDYLTELGKILCQATLSSRMPRPVVSRAYLRSNVYAIQRASSLLWCSQVQERIKDEVTSHTIFIVAVEGDLTRARFCRAVKDRLAPGSTALISNIGLSSVIRFAQGYADGGLARILVAELPTDPSNVYREAQYLAPDIVRVLKSSQVRLCLFVPVEWAKGRDWSRDFDTSLSVETYLAASCISRDKIERWLRETAVTSTWQQSRLEALADKVYEDTPQPFSGLTLDWLHAALDLLEVKLRTERSEEPLEYWGHVMGKFPPPGSGPDNAFELSPRPRSRPPGPGAVAPGSTAEPSPDDFTISVHGKRPARKEEK